jgi:hypothetical protein
MTILFWKHLHINWLARNDDLHGVDAVSREAALVTLAQQETTTIYSLRDQVLPRDRELFYATLDIHFQKEPSSRGLRQWLFTWKPVILQSVKDSKRLNTARTRSIRTYFSQIVPRARHPTPTLPTTQ